MKNLTVKQLRRAASYLRLRIRQYLCLHERRTIYFHGTVLDGSNEVKAFRTRICKRCGVMHTGYVNTNRIKIKELEK